MAARLVALSCLVAPFRAESEHEVRVRLMTGYLKDVLPNRTSNPVGPTTVELAINFVWLQHMSQLDGTFGKSRGQIRYKKARM